ncbi:unnamed protein product, partial [Gongylonema pulchrum]|uniref:Chitin-binding type-2 domain-containing protein n=1 Tax=Gongylonema pulchrum TaxID=637853 RepID=A0A183CX95_9BILA
DCRRGSTIADEHDCGKYFECTSKGYEPRYCNPDHQFNDESGQCEKKVSAFPSVTAVICGVVRRAEWLQLKSVDTTGYARMENGIKLYAKTIDDSLMVDVKKQSARMGMWTAVCLMHFVLNVSKISKEKPKLFQKLTVWMYGRSEAMASIYAFPLSLHPCCCVEEMPESLCRDGHAIADDSHCMRYFVCKQGRFREQFCSDGHSFDGKVLHLML